MLEITAIRIAFALPMLVAVVIVIARTRQNA